RVAVNDRLVTILPEQGGRGLLRRAAALKGLALGGLVVLPLAAAPVADGAEVDGLPEHPTDCVGWPARRLAVLAALLAQSACGVRGAGRGRPARPSPLRAPGGPAPPSPPPPRRRPGTPRGRPPLPPGGRGKGDGPAPRLRSGSQGGGPRRSSSRPPPAGPCP